MTLEDFLAKAGAVSEEDVRASSVVTMGPPSPATVALGMEATMKNVIVGVAAAQFAPAVCMQNGLTDGGFGVEFGNGMVAVGGSTVGAGRGKRRAALEEAPLDKATQQRHKRMIKNRESAARSRERKQAYTVELESLVTQLEEENARLLKEEAWLNKERYKQLMENLIPVTEKRRPPRVLRRFSEEDTKLRSVRARLEALVLQNSSLAKLPLEPLFDVIRRLEESKNDWPNQKHEVACAAVCRSWRSMCKEIVKSPEFSGKPTFLDSLKQQGPHDGSIQCFIKRDKSNLTYHLFLCLSPDDFSRSSSTYIGKLSLHMLANTSLHRENKPSVPFQESVSKGTKWQLQHSSNQIWAECAGDALHHALDSASALEPGSLVPGQPVLLPRSLEDSFGSISFVKSFYRVQQLSIF
ncbi:BZIP domain-containing protein [Forsythia ovata]|uniref:BZIP domain-containing protein n=1 Tax=Forsythia ovata TaxID=205694 RepID=A0ABD1TMM6_9LAMI